MRAALLSAAILLVAAGFHVVDAFSVAGGKIRVDCTRSQSLCRQTLHTSVRSIGISKVFLVKKSKPTEPEPVKSSVDIVRILSPLNPYMVIGWELYLVLVQ